MKMKKGMKIGSMNVEVEIRMAFLEIHGWSIEDCDWKDFIRENREDYLEYREWYLTCYA